MADKLSASTWTSFTKKQDLKLEDKSLLKALAAFDKTDESKPGPRLAALDEVIKQIPELVKALVKVKKSLGDKSFGTAKDQLYELLEIAERTRKDLSKAVEESDEAAKAKSAAEANRKAPAPGGDDEEEESPALLTVKMKPLIKELRKGEAVMPALIATTTKETVVLISRRAISPARGKLLKEQMAAPSGIKFIRGDCRFENGALTFVVQSPAAALAKKLRRALLEQTELKLKVKVRGEDGVEEEDGDNEEEVQRPATAEELAFTQRLLKVRDRYEQALREQHPNAERLKELMTLAREKARDGKDLAGAIGDLAALEPLLPKPTNPQLEAFKVRLKVLMARAMAAGETPAANEAKQLAKEAGQASVQGEGDWVKVDALMTQAEALLGGASAASPGSQGAADPATKASASTPADDAPMARGTAKAPPMNPALAFKARLTGLIPGIKAAEAAGSPTLGQINAKRDEAIALARKKGVSPDEMTQAMALLDEVQALLGSPGSASATPAAPPAGKPAARAAASRVSPRIAFTQSRLLWAQTRDKVRNELRRLESAVLEECKDEPYFAEIKANSGVLYSLLDHLDERLIDKLDEALNANDANERRELNQQALDIVDDYVDFVGSSILLEDISDNDFAQVPIKALLDERLKDLAQKLGQAVAA